MKISIITPSYNSLSTIGDTLKSVSEQNHPEVEHIVIDGASTDGTQEAVKKFSQCVNLISEPDKGIYDAMNKGIGNATGEVIGILNSDDFYVHSKVLSQVTSAFEDSRIDLVYADLVYVDKNNTNKIIRRWRSGEYSRRKMRLGWMPPHPTFFVRANCYKRFGDFETKFESAADYELMLRFLYKHKLKSHYIPEYWVKMRVGGNSGSSLSHRLRANREDRLAWTHNALTPHPLFRIAKPTRKLFQYLR